MQKRKLKVTSLLFPLARIMDFHAWSKIIKKIKAHFSKKVWKRGKYLRIVSQDSEKGNG